MTLIPLFALLPTGTPGKRHSEYLGRIQARFDHFQGPPISAHSTRLFLQTDAIRMTPNLWNNTYTLFLFDHQLVYCKKDLLKRTTYTYKGRLHLDSCRILNLPDGKIFGLTLKNALRIYCDRRVKWFDFCFRSASSKLRFLSTLAAERKFSGHSLFVSELTGSGGGGAGDDGSDEGMAAGTTVAVEYVPVPRLIDFGEPVGDELQPQPLLVVDRPVDAENVMNAANADESQATSNKQQQQQQMLPKQRSDTLPKKSRKLNGKEPTAATVTMLSNSTASNNGCEYSSSSLGRKQRIGNWFRGKAKSTNTTPSHSPTHQASGGGGGGSSHSMLLMTTSTTTTTTPVLTQTTDSAMSSPIKTSMAVAVDADGTSA